MGSVLVRVELVPEQIHEQSWWLKQIKVEPALVNLLRLKHVTRHHVQVGNDLKISHTQE